MQIVFPDSHEASQGIWITRVLPHHLTMFGSPSIPKGKTSVLMVIKPRFDEEKEELAVQAEQVLLLNVGTTARTIVIDVDGGTALGESVDALAAQGPGDKDFRYLVDVHLKGEAREAAHTLLTKVREVSPGDLKRGERNNFSNTPDNFWYVIVQPRVQALSVTVRGEAESFMPSTLTLVTDRPGFTRFQLRGLNEIEEALRLINSSTRSKRSKLGKYT
ncbi:hypothetical protein [Bradyrhizobium sp. Bra64]|uniref:hypothetical protein n=1 Tax=Bradyrhizobium sp. Bra64 TaxID=2926009 RepID=UPI002118D73C|nr:hypothetical protein [Bradyrhizobium sp. Bra64]